jgi:urease accessory protein
MSFLDTEIKASADGVPRAHGRLLLSSKFTPQGSAIDSFRTSGSMKALFTHGPALEGIMINTSGGLTGGDAFDVEITAGRESTLALTTQAAERAYRAAGGAARVDTRLCVEQGASLYWLPQELIVFDGSALARRLRVDLQEAARVLMVEQIVFGRTAMGERITQTQLDDRIEITRSGQPLYLDRIVIDGDAEAQLSASAVARANRAVATVVCVDPQVESKLDSLREMLPETAGASLLAPDLLVLRLLAEDSFLMRRALVPVLEFLKGGALPRPWSL